VAGVVDAVGEGVTQLKPGTRVVSLHWVCGLAAVSVLALDG